MVMRIELETGDRKNEGGGKVAGEDKGSEEEDLHS